MKAYGPLPAPSQHEDARAREELEGPPLPFWSTNINPVTIPWGWIKHFQCRSIVKRHNEAWIYKPDAPGLDVWDEGGDCDDSTPALARTFLAAGYPRGALNPTACHLGAQGHMVLAIQTSWGTLIACNIAGLRWLDDPQLRRYRWDRWMLSNGLWKTLKKPVTLDDIGGFT